MVAIGLIVLMMAAAGYGAFLVTREGNLGPLSAFMPSFTPKKVQPPAAPPAAPPAEPTTPEPAPGESAAPSPAAPADASTAGASGPAPGTSAGASPPENPALPANPPGSIRNPARPPTASLLDELAAVRLPDGAVVVEGKVELPVGTKLRLILRADRTMEELGMAEAYIGAGGGFRSPPFLAAGRKFLAAGRCNVVILSYFNALWQTPEVMSQVGENGNKLPVSGLMSHKSDEFGLAGFHFEATVPVNFP